MGCDIHCYAEYRRKGADPEKWEGHWRSFGQRINPGRNYAAFAAMAGVRNGGEIVPVTEPRGLPNQMGYSATDDNWLFIHESGGDGCATPEEADRYARGNPAAYRLNESGERTHVAHPDWHSHSWLTADEFEEAIKRADVIHQHVKHQIGIEYRALLAVLRFFESSGYEARLMFWFDN